MSSDLVLRPGEPSFTGAARYSDGHPWFREDQSRIYVRFQPEGAELPHVALLDTGAHYCILDREIATGIDRFLTEPLGQMELRTAYGTIRGDLHTHRITLLAEAGDSLDIESTVFVSPDWRAPSFLGYVGALDRLRFAVDPQLNRFYFGSLV